MMTGGLYYLSTLNTKTYIINSPLFGEVDGFDSVRKIGISRRKEGNRVYLLKILGMIMMIGTSAGIGMYYSRILKKRAEALKIMRKNMLLLKGEIRYSHSTLNEAFLHIAEKNKGCYQKFFQQVSQKMEAYQGEPFCEIWKKQLEEQLSEEKSGLQKEDRRQLVLLGETLGFLDKEMQLNTLDLYLENVEEEMKHLFQEMPEKIRLYQVCSVAGGVFLSLLML